MFDFDDSGYGPVAYDLANSLYMVMFDADVNDRPDLYAAFRPAFLAGYANHCLRPPTDDAINEMIQVRVEALARWITDPATAPIGIRTASSEWLDVLASFVGSHVT